MDTGPRWAHTSPVVEDRGELERLWASRVKDARLRLAFARNYVKEVQQHFPDASPDGHYEYQHALRAENGALVEYHRVVQIYSDLVDGKIPDNDGWRKPRE